MKPKKPRHSSPLRYPGGKAALASFLKKTIRLNGLGGCEYFEPYAGGAGAALELLFDGVVEKVHLNDADVRIYSFWRMILRNHTELIRRIESAPLTIEEWRKQNSIAAAPKKHNQFDVGFATFYMNRCNRSGVITGAGPIGGYEQTGKYLLDVRFNRTGLIERIEYIAKNRDFISFSNLDAIDFLKQKLPLGNARSNVFAFLDPPYVVKGQRLYLNAYDASDHRKLSRYLRAQSTVKWVMSYDDCALIRDLYKKMTVRRFRISYALQDKRIAKELLVAPKHVSTPASCKIHGRRTILTNV
jgi:DNA adenine methylase